VTLKVTDATGLSSYCVASVTVSYAVPPTLTTINCRLATFRDQVLALSPPPRLELALAKAILRKEQAEAALAEGKTKRAARSLKAAIRKLTVFERNVRSLTGRKQISAADGASLLAVSGPLKADLQMIADGL
jgi:hypothetical protein